MSRVLLLVNAVADDPVHDAGGLRRVDHRLLRDALDADVVDLEVVGRSLLGRLVRRVAGNYVALAVLGFLRVLRGRADAVFCDNENETLVLALLLKTARRRPAVVTYAVYPGARKKALLFRLLGVHTHVDRWLPYNTVQAERLVLRRGVPPERVQVLPYYADEVFFDRAATQAYAGRPSERPYVLAVGRQHRDHQLLVEVAESLPADVVIAAGSLFSKTPDQLTGRPLPPGVSVVTLDYVTLRNAYRDAAVVVVPTLEEDFAPGLTALAEAMSMGCPVVYTRAQGSGDYLADRRALLRPPGQARPTRGLMAAHLGASDGAAGPHGLYVPPGDADALRRAVLWALEHPQEAAELGRRGRALVEEQLRLDQYVARTVEAVREVLAERAERSGDPLGDNLSTSVSPRRSAGPAERRRATP